MLAVGRLARAALVRSANRTRLARPVSESCSASWRSRSLPFSMVRVRSKIRTRISRNSRAEHEMVTIRSAWVPQNRSTTGTLSVATNMMTSWTGVSRSVSSGSGGLSGHRRMEGGQGEADVEQQPEGVDEQPGPEGPVLEVDLVAGVGHGQRADGGDDEGEGRVLEVDGHHQPGRHRQEGHVHHRVGDRDGQGVEAGIGCEEVVDEQHPEDAEHGDADHGGVDEAGPAAARGHVLHHVGQPDDHQRVHREVERGRPGWGTAVRPPRPGARSRSR